MPEVSNLFTPTRLGAVEIPNRVLLAPMTRSRADRDGVPGPLAPLYYTQRASAGLIVTEASQVAPEGQGYILTPGIHTEAQVEGWRRVTNATHAAGGRIFLQLWHVGRVSHTSFQPNGAAPVAPSAIALPGEAWTYDGMKPYTTPRALETDEIAGVVAQYRRGAELAKQAGFDGVEIHGANGYLIDQFLRDGTNKRTDRYGGSAANRARFLLEVTEAVVAVWGADRVGVRLSPLGAFNDMSDSDPATTFGETVEALGGFGLAYLHMVEQFGPEKLTEEQLGVLRSIRARWHGPYIANGAYDAARGAEAVASGWATAVAYGVPFLANPDLPLRFLTGSELNEPDRATFYGGDGKGYTDYPATAEARIAASLRGHLRHDLARRDVELAATGQVREVLLDPRQGPLMRRLGMVGRVEQADRPATAAVEPDDIIALEAGLLLQDRAQPGRRPSGRLRHVLHLRESADDCVHLFSPCCDRLRASGTANPAS